MGLVDAALGRRRDTCHDCVNVHGCLYPLVLVLVVVVVLPDGNGFGMQPFEIMTRTRRKSYTLSKSAVVTARTTATDSEKETDMVFEMGVIVSDLNLTWKELPIEGQTEQYVSQYSNYICLNIIYRNTGL